MQAKQTLTAEDDEHLATCKTEIHHLQALRFYSTALLVQMLRYCFTAEDDEHLATCKTEIQHLHAL